MKRARVTCFGGAQSYQIVQVYVFANVCKADDANDSEEAPKCFNVHEGLRLVEYRRSYCRVFDFHLCYSRL